jgi:hypothetical protein
VRVPQPYNEQGEARLAINALRGGTATEIAEFLHDIDAAYRATYGYLLKEPLDLGEFLDFYRFYPLPRRIMAPIAYSRIARPTVIPSEIELLPECQLVVSRISINSPGFLEFVGSLNPLSHIREYLKERHERTKDNQYRNKAEQERLKLENKILQQTLVNRQLENIRLLGEIEREFPVEALRRQAWELLGPAYARLGRHQDSGLIADPKKEEEPRPD